MTAVVGRVSDRAAPADGVAPGRWWALTWIALATLLGMSTWFSGTAVVRPLTAEWHLSATARSWLTIAVQLGFVVGSLGSAAINLADVVAPRRIFLVSAIGAAAANVCFALATAPGPGMAWRFVTGVFLAGVYPPGIKLMATWFVRDRGRALGVMVGALTLGSAAPHLLQVFGGLGWRNVVAATSLLTLVGFATAAIAVHEGPFVFPLARFDPRQTGRVLRNRGVLLACLGYFGHMWELYAMWTWFLAFLTACLESHGVANVRPWASLGTFVAIAIGFPACWLGGILSDRWERAGTTALAMAISGTCALTIGLAFRAPLPVVAVLALVWGASVIADSAQFSTLVTEFAEPAFVGTALTLQLGVGFMLTVATIWLVPLAEQAMGWRWAFAVLVPGPVLGILAMLALRRLPPPVAGNSPPAKIL